MGLSGAGGQLTEVGGAPSRQGAASFWGLPEDLEALLTRGPWSPGPEDRSPSPRLPEAGTRRARTRLSPESRGCRPPAHLPTCRALTVDAGRAALALHEPRVRTRRGWAADLVANGLKFLQGKAAFVSHVFRNRNAEQGPD